MERNTGKFISLADYWCSCVPVGKPVSERTMDRHRKLVNDRRRKFGLPLLGRGPRHNSTREAHQYSSRVLMSAKQNPFSPFFSISKYQKTRAAVTKTSKRTKDHVETEAIPVNGESAFSPQITNSELVAVLPDSPPTPHTTSLRATYVSSPTASDGVRSNGVVDIDDDVDTNDCAHYNSNRSPSVSASAVNSTQDNVESCYETEITEAHGSRRRSHAYILFERWAREEKDWVQTFIEFGVTNRLM